MFALLALLPALAACAATAPQTAPSQTTATVAVAVPSEPAIKPEPQLKARDLIGVDANGLVGLLGEPDFRRFDPPAELWNYRTDACLLDIFLYRNGEKSDRYVVTHIAARGHDEADVSDDACVAAASNGKG